MAHGRDEFVLGAIGIFRRGAMLLGLLERFVQALFGRFALGVIAHDLHKSFERSVAIARRRHDPAGPEASAVSSQVPALIERGARLCRALPFLLGNAIHPILRREQYRGRLADDLLLRMAGDALGATVPA